MTDTILVPTADKILQPALEKLYELRPRSFQHVNYRSGVYWHPMLGFRSQAAYMLNRVGTRVKNSRLNTAEGKDLIEYVASEYDALPDTDRTNAIGEVTFTRTATILAGDIPLGSLITRSANLTTQIPLKAAAYKTLADVHFDVGQSTAGPVAIQAVQFGPDANHPVRAGESIPHGAVIPGLFDSTITIDTFSAAGGSNTPDDDYARKYARAYAQGQYGPTEAASRLGALKATGVRNILVYDLPGTGTEQVLVGDSSWGSSPRWARQVQQTMYDNDLVGFGCKVIVSGVTNKVVSIEASVELRDVNYLTETTDVDNAIRKAVTAYLDDRKDWNIWKTDGLKAAISRSHFKVFNCSSAVMKDVAGATVAEITTPNYNLTQYHYFVANNAVKITYSGPS